MRKKYISLPVEGKDPGLLDRDKIWMPTLNVRVLANHLQTPWMPAVVDSGSPYCLFRSDVGEYVRIDVDHGQKGQVGGIISGYTEPIYFHKVKVLVEVNWCIEAYAGFMRKLRVPAILGRNGFFDAFYVRFDHSVDPPELEVEKIPSVQ